MKSAIIKGGPKGLAMYCWSQISGPRYYQSEPLYGQNLLKVKSAQVLLLGIIAEIVSRRQKLRTWTLSHVVTELNKVDVKAWLEAFDYADDLLVHSTCDAPGPLFKQWETAVVNNSGKASELMKSLIRLLRRELRQWFVFNSKYTFRELHQVFGFPGRLNLKIKDLKEVALSSWINTEREGGAIASDSDPERAIISEWFPKVAWQRVKDHVVFHHGPGSVFEFDQSLPPDQKCLAAKYLLLSLNSFQIEMMRSLGLVVNVGDRLMQSAHPYDAMFDKTFLHRNRIEDNWLCQVVFVAKSWKTYRTISKEPVSTMWLQQGIREAIDWWLNTNQCQMSGYYSPGSESQNRILTEIGSLDGSYATLDLKAASDSVSWQLVQVWFAESWLADPLYMVRTPYVYESTTGSVYEQNKFAPMGSAVCFPVESIVFCAICESCRREYCLLHPEAKKASWPWFVVFGDDLVVRAEIADLVRNRLTALRFKVNLRKSYWTTETDFYYRESCGVEYLNGYDVSIVKLPRPNFEGLLCSPRFALDSKQTLEADPRQLAKVAGLVELANNFYSKGYRVSRLMIIHHLLSDFHLPIVFDATGQMGFKTEDPHNRHLERVFNDSLQRTFYRGWRVVTVPKGVISYSSLQEEILEDGTHLLVLAKKEVPDYVRNDCNDTWEPRTSSDLPLTVWTGSSQLYEWLRSHRRKASDPTDEVLSPVLGHQTIRFIDRGLVDPERLGVPVT